MEVIAFISFFLGASWDFFTGVKVPGFDFSFAALFVGLFLAALGLRFLASMLGVSVESATVIPFLAHRPLGRVNHGSHTLPAGSGKRAVGGK